MTDRPPLSVLLSVWMELIEEEINDPIGVMTRRMKRRKKDLMTVRLS